MNAIPDTSAATPDGPKRLAVTGATGFIGSAVARALAAGPDEVRALVRTVLDEPLPGVEYVSADLTDPASLHGALEGADALLHLASYIGSDVERSEAVNVRGTRALLAEAERAGVGRVLYLSTAAVYGAGPHSGVAEGELTPEPVSATSRTRLEAERLVLAARGTVLRPGLVLGEGDRWVVPAIAELLARVPAWCEGGAALLSVVAVEDLARLFAAAVRSSAVGRGRVHHASHPEPISSRELITTLAREGVLPLPEEDLSLEECLERLRENPGRVSERQFSLLSQDHWYRSDTVWQATGCPPGPTVVERLAKAAPWYRDLLAGAAARQR